MGTPMYARSTGPLVSGVLFTAVGAVLIPWSRSLRVENEMADMLGASVTNTAPAHVTILTFGAIALVAGLALLCTGLVRLTRNVDLAAYAATQVLAGNQPAAQESHEVA